MTVSKISTSGIGPLAIMLFPFSSPEELPLASYPESTTSVALLACSHCIDEFAFDWQRIRNLAYGWRVRVRCLGCRSHEVQMGRDRGKSAAKSAHEANRLVVVHGRDPEEIWMATGLIPKAEHQRLGFPIVWAGSNSSRGLVKDHGAET
jgi:hypothetical protein